jgi:hypothetical protein
MHAEDLEANSDQFWKYTLCGDLLPRGFVFSPIDERRRVTCGNCLRAKGFKNSTHN